MTQNHDLPLTVTPRRTNSLAIYSLVLSIASVFLVITCIPGVILGHMALKQIKETGEDGEAFAKAGIIVGWVCIALIALMALLFVLVLRTMLNLV